MSEQLVAPLAEPKMNTVPPAADSVLGAAATDEIVGNGPVGTVADVVAVAEPAAFDAAMVKVYTIDLDPLFAGRVATRSRFGCKQEGFWGNPASAGVTDTVQSGNPLTTACTWTTPPD